jgi:hypothetical protein
VDETSGNVSQLDALLPPEMAHQAEAVGVRKCRMDGVTTFTLALLAGAFIALGGVFATTALAGAGTAPWGAIRVLAGAAFSVGLVLVVVGGAELFTGNNLIVMAWASRRVSTWALLRNWLIVFAGNFVGAGSTAALVYLGGVHRGGGGAFGVTALAIAHAKLELGFTQAVALGDMTGKEVMRAVIARTQQLPNVRIWERSFTLDLLTHEGRCRGALVWHAQHGRTFIWAKETILCTGGAGQIFRETTNPEMPSSSSRRMYSGWRACKKASILSLRSIALLHGPSPSVPR